MDRPPASDRPDWLPFVVGVVACALLVVGASALLFQYFATARCGCSAPSCLSNEKQQALGLLQYVSDYDDHLPPSDGQRYREQIMPYIKNSALFTCPSDPNGPPSYSFNARLGAKRHDALLRPEATVMLFEGTHWRQPDAPHEGLTRLAFVDGHVKSYTPEQAFGLVWVPGYARPSAKRSDP